MTTRRVFAGIVFFISACGQTPDSSSTSRAPDSTPPPAAPAPDTAAAPWTGAHLSSRNLPAVYRTEWSTAPNRAQCALVAFAGLGDLAAASPRRATFAGGWGVAYDWRDDRSAFGIAGTAVKADDAAFNDWPHKRTWSDGSSVGYGPEGGAGPNQLAYLRIAGQECLYNVWSRLGIAHLETLLGQVRFVDSP